MNNLTLRNYTIGVNYLSALLGYWNDTEYKGLNNSLLRNKNIRGR